MDFAIPQVREHIFGIIQEVAQNYDVDCIGMEFFKYWPFFRESLEGNPVEPEHLELMNDFLRRIRHMADEQANRRGRPLLLAAHTPFSLADSIHVGVDLETWVAEGLIDLLMPGGNLESVFCSSYNDMIALGHKYEVPVYPCVSWGFWDRWAFLGLTDGKYRQFGSWVETLRGAQPERVGRPSFILVFNSWEGTMAAWREPPRICSIPAPMGSTSSIPRSASRMVARDRRTGNYCGKRQALRNRAFCRPQIASPKSRRVPSPCPRVFRWARRSDLPVRAASISACICGIGLP